MKVLEALKEAVKIQVRQETLDKLDFEINASENGMAEATRAVELMAEALAAKEKLLIDLESEIIRERIRANKIAANLIVANERFTAAEKRGDRAIDLLEEIEWSDYMGCFTGDCSCGNANQCVDSIKLMLAHVHAQIESLTTPTDPRGE